MRDREFLIWIYYRLKNVHGENEFYDYMHKLRAIISDMSEDQETPNDGRGKNSIEELLKETATDSTENSTSKNLASN